MGPSNLEHGSVLVVRDEASQKYLATELGVSKTLIDKWNVFTTGNDGLFIRILNKNNGFEPMPIKPVTPENTKPNLAMGTLGQYITEDVKSNMKEVYEKHLHDTCVRRKKDIAVRKNQLSDLFLVDAHGKNIDVAAEILLAKQNGITYFAIS